MTFAIVRLSKLSVRSLQIQTMNADHMTAREIVTTHASMGPI
jgi:hypothetical protein